MQPSVFLLLSWCLDCLGTAATHTPTPWQGSMGQAGGKMPDTRRSCHHMPGRPLCCDNGKLELSTKFRELFTIFGEGPIIIETSSLMKSPTTCLLSTMKNLRIL